MSYEAVFKILYTGPREHPTSLELAVIPYYHSAASLRHLPFLIVTQHLRRDHERNFWHILCTFECIAGVNLAHAG